MKRVIAAVCLSVTVLFGGVGCSRSLSGSEVDGTQIQPSPPPEVSVETTEQAAESAAAEVTGAPPSEGEGAGSIKIGTEIVPQSDDRILEDSDLADLDNWGLTLARNEIFARHGRSFDNEHLVQHFTGQPWYQPNPNYERAWLSAVEEANANFILKYQKLKYEIPSRQPR